ncbi:sensor domain-containing diguanylate cyclase [Texcoconibacillus texcoconensis]|uniref:Diguanylate cyclase (GGDEF)-like protein/PAS domain S-box-containing protein n=1 Tax=Texcoconibacillus texcoconensis TaxID=1095777 RepID=A0A840QMJ0_9BACI|nr:MASE3 domain-containing protein [Texcoconibacillus texcoconensis]MBB5172578.1 diguanylate cyclase (GGDEF)-like protein/PAS domain S-box-containing protein [Texcoconibacillus texcoconensis]
MLSMWNKSEKRTILSILILFLSLLIIALFEEQIAVFYNPKNHLSFHIILEFLSIAIAFSIALLAWTIFPQTLSRYRLFMGMLFLAVGLIDLLHTLTYNGMPYFFMESSIQRATWYWVLGRMTEATFLLFILLSKDKQIHDLNRNYMFLIPLIFVIALGTIVDTQIDRLPVLVIEGEGTTLLKNSFEYIVIAIHLYIIKIVFDEYRKNKNDASLYIILASFSLIFAGVVFTFYVSVHDILNFLGHIFKVIGYYYLFKSVYVSTLEQPFEDKEQAEIKLKESKERYQKLIEVLPDAILVHSNNKILFCNQVFAEMMKVKNPKQLIGTSIEQIIHPEYRTKVIQELQQLYETDSFLPPSHRKYVLQNGEVKDVEVTGVTTMYENKKAIMTVVRDVSDRKQMEWQLEENKQLYQSLFEFNQGASFAVDKNSNFTMVNQSATDMLGYTKGELLHSSFIPLLNKPYLEATVDHYNQSLKGDSITFRTQFVHKYGYIIDVNVSTVPIIVKGEITGIIGVAQDITQQLQAEKELRDSEQRYKSLIELYPEGIYVHDKETFLFLNNQTAEILGAESYQDIIGKHYIDFVHPDYQKDLDYTIRRVLDRKDTLFKKQEFVLIRLDGTKIEVEANTTLITYNDKLAILGVLRDVTEQKMEQEKLKQANEILKQSSQIDGLTNIPNRRYYDEVLEKEWKRAKRSSGYISLIMIDIDHFKVYNDTYGHLQGDECLKKVSACLKSSILRSTDFVARYGGEEFSVILPETDLEGAIQVAEVIRKNIEALQIENIHSAVSPVLTVSAGVATMKPEKDDSSDEIIKKADEALYKAKNLGRNRVQVWNKYYDIRP